MQLIEYMALSLMIIIECKYCIILYDIYNIALYNAYIDCTL